MNMPGTFQCVCEPGLVLLDKLACDVDECATENGGCSHTCKNLAGGYTCECPPGYQLDEDVEKTCIDINECATEPDLVKCSGDGSSCKNTPGSFECTCTEGFKLNPDGVTCRFKTDPLPVATLPSGLGA